MTYLADTNLLLRWVELGSPAHALVVLVIEMIRKSAGTIFICPQNLVEFWSVATRPVAVNGLGMDTVQADREIRRIEATFTFLGDTPDIHVEWRRLVVAHAVSGKQVHDARLAAVMIAHGISHLLTFNTADFARFTEIITVNPADLVPAP